METKVTNYRAIFRILGIIILIIGIAEIIPWLYAEFTADREVAVAFRICAPLTIALGPGFTAGVDARCVIETMRGHDLGRIYYTGSAKENTGVPGMVAGYDMERVIHAPASGRLELISGIGEIVEKEKIIAVIETGKTRVKVPASLSGVLRGILPENFEVTQGMKMADIDPRIDQVENCSTVSDKARCIGGSVLQLVVAFEKGLI